MLLGDVAAALGQVLRLLAETSRALETAAETWDDAAEGLRETLRGSQQTDVAQLLASTESVKEQFAQLQALVGRVEVAVLGFLERLVDPCPTSPVQPATVAQVVAHPSMDQRVVYLDRVHSQEWAATQQAKLQQRPRGEGPTTGLVFWPGVDEIVVTSGGRKPPPKIQEAREERMDRRRIQQASALLREPSPHYPNTWRGEVAPVADHCEVKAAMLMVEAGQRHATIVINNTAMYRGEYRCERAVRAILPRGSTLVVWTRGASAPIIIHGEA